MAFAIDFVRQLIEQTLHEQHILNSNYFGGPNQVNLFSFYEQLQKEDEVNRYVEKYRDLIDQQNRTGLIMNGTILAPENPTITNINSATIIPMSFTLAFRVKLKDRDLAIDTLENMVALLKGRKHDIAEMKNGTLFKVGTMANNVNGSPLIKNGDYIGELHVSLMSTLNTAMTNKLSSLASIGVEPNSAYPKYFYYGAQQRLGANPVLSVAYKENSESSWEKITDDETKTILFPPQQTFKKWQLSVSFDSIRVDEPKTLNAEDYCTISFGGSATLGSKGIVFGNQLTKLGIKKTKIMMETPVDISDSTHWLEPLELPSSNNANTFANLLNSNKFIANSHTDSLAISQQYSFVVDEDNDLIKQFFKYARYGKQGSATNNYTDGITPNMIFTINEYWSAWGNVEKEEYKAKIVESIDIENTESDVLSIVVPFQVQGENN